MKITRCPAVLLLLWLIAGQAGAETASNAAAALEQFNREGDFAVLLPHVVEQHEFFGLAAYYNGLSIYRVSSAGVEQLKPGEKVRLAEGDWLAAVGRFNAVILNAPGTRVEVAQMSLTVLRDSPAPYHARLVSKDELRNIEPVLDELRYHNLWLPLAELARAVEWALLTLQSIGGFGWGITIVLFTVLLKILLVPLGLQTARMQKRVSQFQGQLAPVLAEIKANYDGEEAHNRIVAAHKELGISIFFALKPMLMMFVQVPVWIAVFNALGEMPQLAGANFLWIDDLAYPDSIGTLPFTMPLFGNTASLLPWLMTGVTILSTYSLQDRHAPATELKGQKRNLYLMALAFLVLFYPFPAAMVLYWTLSNALQMVQQQFMSA